MQKEIFIHIGFFKTGTTSIQKFLREQKLFLEQNDIFVPDQEIANHHLLPISLIVEKTSFRPIAWPKCPHEHNYYWNILKQQIKETQCSKVIISSESFCDFLHPNAISEQKFFANFIKEFFAEYRVKIVVYVRDIFPYLKSLYKELIKHGKCNYTYQDMLNSFTKEESFHAFPKKVLDFYSNIFGQEALIIKKYNRKLLKNEDVVSDFLSLFNININIKRNEIQENLSLTDHSAYLKRIFNDLEFKDQNFNGYITSLLIYEDGIAKKEKKEVSKSEAINDSALALKKQYGVSILDEEVKTEDYSIDPKDKFIIQLLSLIIKQNRKTHADIEQIKKMIKMK